MLESDLFLVEISRLHYIFKLHSLNIKKRVYFFMIENTGTDLVVASLF